MYTVDTFRTWATPHRHYFTVGRRGFDVPSTNIYPEARSIDRGEGSVGIAGIQESRQPDNPSRLREGNGSGFVGKHRGRIRPLQESPNNKVDVTNPPPVLKMPPSFVDILQNIIWGKRKDGRPLTKEEQEKLEKFHALGKDAQREDKEKKGGGKEVKNRRKSLKRLDGWELDREILRQRNKIEDAEFEAGNKAAAVERERKRLEMLERRAQGSPGASHRRAQAPKPDKAVPKGRQNFSVDNGQLPASSSECTVSQLRPKVERSDIAPSQPEQRTARGTTLQRSQPDREVSGASRSKESAQEANSQEGVQSSLESPQPSSVSDFKGGSRGQPRPRPGQHSTVSQQPQSKRQAHAGGAGEPESGSAPQQPLSGGRNSASRTWSSPSQLLQGSIIKDQEHKNEQQRTRSHRASSTPNKPVPPSTLWQGITAKESESSKEVQRTQAEKQPSVGVLQIAASRQQQSSRPNSESKNEQQRSNIARKSSASKTPVTPTRQKQTQRSFLPSLMENNVVTIKGIESEATFIPQTELGRGVGDMARSEFR